MRILHVKGSNLAWAPDAIAEATNRWTEHTAEVFTLTSQQGEKSNRQYVMNVHTPDVVSLGPLASGPLTRDDIARRFDIVHFHNKPRLKTSTPSLILYHSEPGPRVDLTYQGPKYVVAQYQMTLPEYADCKPMRNVINFIGNPLYDPIDIRDKIRVAYSPSILEAENKWYDKGAKETIPILERLKAKYPDRFDFDLIHGVPLDECLARKRMCNIVIDECVTGSYHRSGLEGLAMGKMTIAGVTDEMEDRLKAVCGVPPFQRCPIEDIEFYLDTIVKKNMMPIHPDFRRDWMERHWHPRDIALQWVDEYRKVLG